MNVDLEALEKKYQAMTEDSKTETPEPEVETDV